MGERRCPYCGESIPDGSMVCIECGADISDIDFEKASEADEQESMLIECPACKNMVSKMAEACPRCGHPIARKINSNKNPNTVPVYANPQSANNSISNTSQNNSETPASNNNSSSSSTSGCLGCVGFIVVIYLVFSLLGSCGSSGGSNYSGSSYSSGSSSSSSSGYSSGSDAGRAYNQNDYYYRKNDHNNDGKLTDEEFDDALENWYRDAEKEYDKTH